MKNLTRTELVNLAEKVCTKNKLNQLMFKYLFIGAKIVEIKDNIHRMENEPLNDIQMLMEVDRHYIIYIKNFKKELV